MRWIRSNARLRRGLCGVLLLAGFHLAGPAQALPAGADEWVVRYRPGHAPEPGDVVLRQVDARTYVLRAPADTGNRAAPDEAAMRARPGVEFIESNAGGRFEALPPAGTEDPLLASQWWLPAVGAERVWPWSDGQGVRVAVVDSGVDLDHPDLQPALAPDGYDFGDEAPDPQDRIGHGTSVAGVIAAVRGNGLGVSGLAPGVRLLPLKISVGMETSFSSDRLARAIHYAVARGARVINLSLTATPSEIVREAVAAALAQGVLVVAAAGNGAGPVAFPANLPGVLAVGAGARDGRLWPSSNRGLGLALLAPGERIVSTQLGGAYVERSGTSLAAPVVSATLAAMWALQPDLPAGTLRAELLAAAPPGGAIYPQLDAAGAVGRLLPLLWLPAAHQPSGVPWTVAYRLPPLPSASDLYVGLAVAGRQFWLSPSGTWSEGETPLPLLRAWRSAAATEGLLFGADGLFPPLPVPPGFAGRFTLQMAVVDVARGQLLGGVRTVSGEVR